MPLPMPAGAHVRMCIFVLVGFNKMMELSVPSASSKQETNEINLWSATDVGWGLCYVWGSEHHSSSIYATHYAYAKIHRFQENSKPKYFRHIFHRTRPIRVKFRYIAVWRNLLQSTAYRSLRWPLYEFIFAHRFCSTFLTSAFYSSVANNR